MSVHILMINYHRYCIKVQFRIMHINVSIKFGYVKSTLITINRRTLGMPEQKYIYSCSLYIRQRNIALIFSIAELLEVIHKDKASLHCECSDIWLRLRGYIQSKFSAEVRPAISRPTVSRPCLFHTRFS